MKVTIAPDFRNLFRPLTEPEMEQAKANNLADPNHESIPPVCVWEGIVIDGHHTLKIRENLRVDGKPVKIRYRKMEFPDRASAMAYAIEAQLGRRNLDPSQVAIALAKLPKAKHGGDRKSDQVANLPVDRETIAEQHGIGSRTLRSADKVHEHGAKAVEQAVASGTVSVSDAASIADLPKKQQVAALKKVTSGKAKTLKAAAGSKPKKKQSKPAGDKVATREPGDEQSEADLAKVQIKIWADAVGRWFGQSPSIDDYRNSWPSPIGDRVLSAAKEFYAALNAWRKEIK